MRDPSTPGYSPRAYRALLHAYPAGFRGRFAAAMEETFTADHARLAAAPRRTRAAFWLATIVEALTCGLRERWAARGRRHGIPIPRGASMFSTLWTDVRYAWRALRAAPVVSAIAIGSLALGIGANTALFSVFYQVLLKPLPFPEPDRLVFVWNTYPGINLPKASVSIPDYVDRKAQAPALADAALYTPRTLTLVAGHRPELLHGLAVTPSFFSTLGRAPLIGRAFTDRDATPGGDRFAILTHDLWTSRFAGDRDLIGRTIQLDNEAYEVAGVLPADFRLPQDAAILVPFSFTPDQMADTQRGHEFSMMIGRLRPGATIAQLDDEMRAIVQRNLQRLPRFQVFAASSGFGGYAVPMRDELVGDVRTPLYVIQLCVLVVLLIACANVANLLLMRVTGRARELALRVTLGAPRMRLVRQLLTESLLLAGLGGAAGLGIGLAGVRLLLAASARQLPGSPDASLHPAVLTFTVLLSVITGLVFGLVPALAVVRGQTASLLRDEGTRTSASRRTNRLRGALVAAETALAVVLLVGAGLLVKSFMRLQAVDPGFSPAGVLTARVALPDTRYGDDASRVLFWERLLDHLRSSPGVAAVSMAQAVPFDGSVNTASYSIVGYTPPPGTPPPHGNSTVVGDDYFGTMHIPLVKGRFFTASDTAASPRVVVIDDLLASRYFAGRDPIGHEIQSQGQTFTIVGVAGTIRADDLGQPAVKERIYYAYPQRARDAMTLVVKTDRDPRMLVNAVRQAVLSVDPEQPIADVRTVDDWMSRSLEPRRAPMLLVAVFGAVALVLSAIGIYGVLAFSVAQRTRELGIRQALGAAPRAIFALVFRRGLAVVGVGLVVGLAAALAVSRYLQSLLVGVGARDVQVFAGVTALLVAVAALACYVPARRATRVNPVEVLRDR
ncbi:MAG TPA: ABC transporter permease [Vicinamibacterales bacterium]|nr:ABC transporter permease [Vicinamibacterales bacterium]